MLRSVCLLSTLVLTFVLAQEECFRSKDGVDYRGKVNVTLTGRTCQYWGAQTPHSHMYGYLYTERNYCRNPDHEPNGTWCYTVDKAKRWEFCKVTKCTQPFNPCYSTPCQNGGTCTVIGSNKRKYACTCPSQWTGTQCETEAPWKSCDSQPCQNGGTCIESKFSFTCVCAPSWIGKFCNVQLGGINWITSRTTTVQRKGTTIPVYIYNTTGNFPKQTTTTQMTTNSAVTSRWIRPEEITRQEYEVLVERKKKLQEEAEYYSLMNKKMKQEMDLAD